MRPRTATRTGARAGGLFRRVYAPAALVVPFLLAGAASPGLVYVEDFEGEGAARGGAIWADPAVSLTRVEGSAERGSRSLLVGGVSSYTQGAGFVVGPRRLPAGYYRVSVAVRLADPVSVAGEPRQDMGIALLGASGTSGGPDTPGAAGPPGASDQGTVALRDRVVQVRVARLGGARWGRVTMHLEHRPGPHPLRVGVRPLRHCEDALPVPLPFLVDDVEVEYLGSEEPLLPQLAPLACPLSPPVVPSDSLSGPDAG